MVDKSIKVIRNINKNKIPHPWNKLIDAVKEIECLLEDLALDIEFAINKKGDIIIFQVRPLAAVERFITVEDEKIYIELKKTINEYKSLKKNSITDKTYTLSDMSFWNPAEIIGGRSDNLAYSMYNHLILNHSWNAGLVDLNYRKVDRPLMVRLCNKPYIEVETAFLSLMPKGLDKTIEKKLTNYYISKLLNNPEFHDKIEFEISHNYFSPIIDNQLLELKGILNNKELIKLRTALFDLTSKIFYNYEKIKLNDEKSIAQLAEKRSAIKKNIHNLKIQDKIKSIIELLDDTKRLGTVQFSRAARLAFIGNAFLKDLVKKNIINKDELNNFFLSIDTVATELNNDFSKVLNKKISINTFNNIYGHLRPGTYDIKKLPYSKNKDYFSKSSIKDGLEKMPKVKINNNDKSLKNKIDNYLLKNYEIKISSEFLFDFIVGTTKAREFYKFEFTKNLSLALELIVEIGAELNFDRDELSKLSIECLLGSAESHSEGSIRNLWKSIIKGQEIESILFDYLSLPSIIFDENDLSLIRSFSSKPNFISSKKIFSQIIDLENLKINNYNSLKDKIIILEKADPGYDWIFSKNIGGLITKFGGAASHMAIRCAEFGIPAAIGCGESVYESLKLSNSVELDCKNQIIIRQN